ncbi:MAG: hypothetical protein Q4C82_00745 [Eubacteriales bacterium]|nr:hypothetical protein [Eubacteriales bacterium]
MTIKELADLYVRTTGLPMSRQNLTQRLRRDNFPEQDMRIFAALLGYQVSIHLEASSGHVPELYPAAVFAASHPIDSVETSLPSAADAPAPESRPDAALRANAEAGEFAEAGTRAAVGESAGAGTSAAAGELAETGASAAAGIDPEPDEGAADAPVEFQIPEAFRKPHPAGEINPLTGQEYLSNTVRRHPEIEEYVQVYDRSTHAWADVREDYFWEFQEKKKQMLGKDYRPPIRI